MNYLNELSGGTYSKAWYTFQSILPLYQIHLINSTIWFLLMEVRRIFNKVRTPNQSWVIPASRTSYGQMFLGDPPSSYFQFPCLSSIESYWTFQAFSYNFYVFFFLRQCECCNWPVSASSLESWPDNILLSEHQHAESTSSECGIIHVTWIS